MTESVFLRESTRLRGLFARVGAREALLLDAEVLDEYEDPRGKTLRNQPMVASPTLFGVVFCCGAALSHTEADD